MAKTEGQRLRDEKLRDMEVRGNFRVTVVGKSHSILPFWS